MTRVSEEELSRLKREVSVEQLVRTSGVELKKHGKDLVGRCPWHDDKTPSLIVTPEKNLWHCMGACQAGGSVIDWVMKAQGVSFRHAVELLREGRPLSSTEAAKLPAPLDVNAADQELLDQVAAYYHDTLQQSPEALAYLEARGLTSPEMISQFRLGFANRTLGYRLPSKRSSEGAELRGRLMKLGVLRESGHEHLNGSLVIPILDEDGHVQGMYGRKITKGLRPGTPLHLYLPGPHRGVFNALAMKGMREMILCESLIDALTFWCAGYRHVTSSYGIEGFTEEMQASLKRHKVQRVLIAYDADAAGDKAAKSLAPRLLEAGLEVRRIMFPRGLDANSYALMKQPAQKSLRRLLERCVFTMGDPPRGAARTLTVVPAPLPDDAAEEEVTSALAAEPPLAAKPLPDAGAAAEVTPATAAELPPLAAEPLPAERTSAALDVKGDEVTLTLGERRYRVRGLSKNTSLDVLRVNLLAAKGDAFHVDTLDLYAAKQRAAFIVQASKELRQGEDILKKDLAKLLQGLEKLQDERIEALLSPKPEAVEMTPEERACALELLRDPNLLDRILADFERCGVVGEETNKLVGYLAAASRKLEDPLAVIIQSSSAAGKSSLMEAVLSFMPDEETTKYSAMTGQSLFYLGETDLKHKILAIVEEEGAERASYALKLLQSEKELSIASTGKDPTSGKLTTHEYRVEGPVMIFLTTTAIEIDEELLNRCLVLTVDEEREQTRAIHALQRQRQTLEGLLARQERAEVLALHKNAQRLLRPLLVANPYAEQLTFLDDKTRTRRDHMKYLTLIRTIALLHQHQRPVKTVMKKSEVIEYIEVAPEDIATANRLANEILGRSLDELPPQTRRLLSLLDELVTATAKERAVDRADVRFTRRELREATGWGNTQLKLHLGRLEELEYVVAHKQHHAQRSHYELLYEGEGRDGTPFLMGLLDAGQLPGSTYDANRSGQNGNRSGQNGNRSGGGRPLVGGWSGGGRGAQMAEKLNGDACLPASMATNTENSHIRAEKKEASYLTGER